ncbi:hypothetical protein ACWT_6253 [Actinoplanes sp. SE50]|uniref:hypothetical protein n=1 Tax=unclassified Actinoplanes TaxID=2626549 RepID=UPI00023ED129|nr:MULTISPECIES: hypothetical protein [unclassified Actinoplanes]AEV87268.1 hypothetical protein ACPL_6386 [Actinoplanes sp. SE50/110]ATO85668.1 hypothetical protein ACWT_6253 [Actinoplanes sp. SE50]SLM03081.1 hypothetical protein ACSP50_6370 [Actinoplanes sp. SE50/110]
MAQGHNGDGAPDPETVVAGVAESRPVDAEVIEALRAATAHRDGAAEVADPAEPSILDAEPEAAEPEAAEPEAAEPDGADAATVPPEVGGTGLPRTAAIGKRWGALIAGVLAVVLLVLIGLACSGVFTSAAPPTPLPSADPLTPSAPGSSGLPATPKAAVHPARTAGDLDQVCGGTFFPASPKYQGRGPHPILISARERLDLTDRATRTLHRFAFAGAASGKLTWAPAVPKVQLVACLDLAGPGARLRDCPGDTAKSPKLPLVVGRYRLTVVEVATGRTVAESELTGAGKSCPWVAMTGSDKTLYSSVDDNQLYRALKAPVAQAIPGSAQPRKRS